MVLQCGVTVIRQEEPGKCCFYICQLNDDLQFANQIISYFSMPDH